MPSVDIGGKPSRCFQTWAPLRAEPVSKLSTGQLQASSGAGGGLGRRTSLTAHPTAAGPSKTLCFPTAHGGKAKKDPCSPHSGQPKSMSFWLILSASQDHDHDPQPSAEPVRGDPMPALWLLAGLMGAQCVAG